MKQSAFYQIATRPSEAVAITTGDAGPRQSAARDRLHCWRVQAADHAEASGRRTVPGLQR